ncbi:4-hydroxythreonine-4-phosphate dehydrogenase PdxA [Spirosoma utsteinense]|uniref:4-hydroxythreonine-4-phosphate dehydrogenase n=1 Tax=Spirosoma utsteinense TaxID=2585773 RepID=A0ABR6W9X6_9BACT|nr:4-hydroxythreonine-4-phosphate dehydrogenase PdxA [Spirosoma utsteinense]MBC3787741.1 4-hydroxythreonine-4-phosphate dehydrogenase [Spirosoma utsteinense]MBC3792655.1 4-hydroxythreonine-4-phosphate dehydrogenase [Spirosoma utsteinense]
MEQRQPDEPNESRVNPSPKQPSDSQNTNSLPPNAQPSSDERDAVQPESSPRDATQRDAAQRDAAQQNPNQRNNRQQGRGNNGQRDNRNRPDGGPRENSVRATAPQETGPEPEGQNQRENAPQNAPQQQNRGQRDATQRNEGQRDAGQRGGGKRDGGQRPNRNEGRPNGRDRGVDPRERDLNEGDAESRARDDRYRAEDLDRDKSDGQSNQPIESQGREDRLVIGISLGDYNGIGPEVILKALQYNRLQKLCTPVIYGSMRILNRYRNLIDMKDWNLNGTPNVGQISHKLTNVITCWPDQSQDIQPGQVTPEAGQAALACLQRAVDDLKEGKLDALVTAPINKYNIQSEEFQFPGHTEYLAQQFEVQDNLMFMVSDTLRVGVVTGHVPLGRVRQNVTRERIAQKLNLMMQSLKQDFGIEKPKIAVLGLNPHAGEEGLLGNEEQDIIKPLLTDLRNKGQLVFGPYPADGFFGTRNYRNFDAVLAMYHDQGLIPFKAIAFEEGVNFTAGMPVVRTSPDHGTAYDIAGKNLADETSMLQAIYTAIDVARQRKEFLELEAGALKKTANKSVS